MCVDACINAILVHLCVDACILVCFLELAEICPPPEGLERYGDQRVLLQQGKNSQKSPLFLDFVL
jgi:hypothetical protein